LTAMINIRMPSLSASMETGVLTRWRVSIGQAIAVGDIIAEVETDKSVLEYESPEAGIVLRMLVQEGASGVAVGAPILELAARNSGIANDASRAGQGAVHPATLGSLGGVGGGVRPLSAVRRVMAERMTEAKRTVPHFYLTGLAHLDALVARRAELLSIYQLRPPSINDFVIRAAALALREHGDLNVQYVEGGTIPLETVDVGVAIATSLGTFAPLVRGADQKSVHEIGEEVRALRVKAENRTLPPQDSVGGSITVSNLGMHAVSSFAAIITPPQIMILAVGAAEQQAVVLEGVLRVGVRMSLTLSADHRVLDGTSAARLLRSITDLLADPATLGA
jgi:pyruvate dehydrogenase E2 component (dihydrolipoamide acetyltransferase)